MGPLVVVDIDECVDGCLEFAEGVGGWPCGEPFLHCLLEAFNFAGGGGVTGSGVLLGDAEFGEPGFELVPASSPARETNRVDESVAGEH